MSYKELEIRFITWAEANANIRAVVVIGSRARRNYPADSYSDLDLIVFTNRSQDLISDANWLLEIENVWIAYLSITGQNHPEWFVLFQGGLKTDIVIIDAQPNIDLSDMLNILPYQNTLQRGMRVLFNRIDSDYEIVITHDSGSSQQSSDEFQSLINKILMQIGRIAIFIRRRELWQSQTAMAQLRNLILELIDMHSRLTGTATHDSWHDGRFINKWADPAILDKIPALFPGYSEKELTTSIDQAQNIVELLASEISAELDNDYPTPGQKATISWIATI